jgi:hypothetical protein
MTRPWKVVEMMTGYDYKDGTDEEIYGNDIRE